MGGFVSKAIGVATGIIKGASVGKILGGIVLGAIATKAIGWLMPKPDIPDFDGPEAESAQGVLLNKSSNNAQIPVVYGERKLGVSRAYVNSSGTDNQYLYMAAVLCEGEIDSIQSIFIDDKQVSWTGSLTHGTTREVASGDSNFYKDGSSHIQVQAFLGQDGQTASSILTANSNWDSNYRLRGVAYLAFRFKWNQDVFSGLPNIKAVVRGKKVDIYDAGLNLTPSTYTTNPAWHLFDYLKNDRYGKGLSNTDLDIPSFVSAAQPVIP